MLYCCQATDESDSSTYKIKSDLRQAQLMGAGLEVFRIWNLSDQGPKEKETKERKEGGKKLVYNIIIRNLLPMKLEKSARIEIYRKTICPAIRGALMGDWALNPSTLFLLIIVRRRTMT